MNAKLIRRPGPNATQAERDAYAAAQAEAAAAKVAHFVAAYGQDYDQHAAAAAVMMGREERTARKQGREPAVWAIDLADEATALGMAPEGRERRAEIQRELEVRAYARLLEG